MKKRLWVRTNGLILSLFLIFTLFPPPAGATGTPTMRRRSFPSASSRSSDSGRTSGSVFQKKSSPPAPKTVSILRSDLRITDIRVDRQCSLVITITNTGPGKITPKCYNHAKLEITLAKAQFGATVTRTYALKAIDSHRYLTTRGTLKFRPGLRVTEILTVRAELKNLYDDARHGMKWLSKSFHPGRNCLPVTTTRPTTRRPLPTGTASHVSGRIIQNSFDLSIERAYVKEQTHRLHVVIKNIGARVLPVNILLKGRVDIDVRPDAVTGSSRTPASPAKRAAARSRTGARRTGKKLLLSRLDPRKQLTKRPSSREADCDTGITVTAPSWITVRLLPLKGDGTRGKKSYRFHYGPRMAAFRKREVMPKKTSGFRATARRVSPKGRTDKNERRLVQRRQSVSSLASAGRGKSLVKSGVGASPRGKNLKSMDMRMTVKPDLELFLNRKRIFFDNDLYGHVFLSGDPGASVPLTLSWMLANAGSRSGLKDFSVEIKVCKEVNQPYGDWVTFRRVELPNGLPNAIRFNIRDIFRCLRENNGPPEMAGYTYQLSIRVLGTYVPVQAPPGMVATSGMAPATGSPDAYNSHPKRFDRIIYFNYHVDSPSDSSDHPDPAAFPPSRTDRRITDPGLLTVNGNQAVVRRNRSGMFGDAFGATWGRLDFIHHEFAICPEHDCYSFATVDDPLEWFISVTDLIRGGRFIISGKRGSVDAYLALTREIIEDARVSDPGETLHSHPHIFLNMKEGDITFLGHSVFRVSARLILRGHITTPDCGFSTVKACFEARDLVGNRKDPRDTLERHLHTLEVVSHPVRLDLSNTAAAVSGVTDIAHHPLPRPVLEHAIQSITVGNQQFKGAVIHEGEQIGVRWNPLQVPSPSESVPVWFAIYEYDNAGHTWVTNELNCFIRQNTGHMRLLADAGFYHRHFLRAGLYKIRMETLSMVSEPVYVQVLPAAGPISRYSFRLTDLRTGSGTERNRLYVTLANRSGRAFRGELRFDVSVNGTPAGTFDKSVSVAGGSESAHIRFVLPDTVLAPFKTSQTVHVDMIGTDLWDASSIERTFTLPEEDLWNLAFQGSDPVEARERNGTVTIRARLRTGKSRFCPGWTYRYDVLLRVSTAHEVIFYETKHVNTDDTEVTFTVDSSNLIRRANGEKNLYFEVCLDCENRLEERNERDNLAQTRFRLP